MGEEYESIKHPFNIPGPRTLVGFENLFELFNEMSEKYHVDVEDIMIGRREYPPSDASCLVYVSANSFNDFAEYFRKNLQPEGRWVCESRLHHAHWPGVKEGTYDYRNGIAFI